ncbi:MAG: hypothetical protein ACRD1X_12510 [Vicinamibacteria bacterium]
MARGRKPRALAAGCPARTPRKCLACPHWKPHREYFETRIRELEADWEAIVKSKIRWMQWAKRKGWQFPPSAELVRLWPLDHFDEAKETK